MKIKKAVAAVVLGGLVASMSVLPVFAANTTSGQSNLTLYVPNDPVYTVTVPETVTINPTEITDVPITVSDMENIPDTKKVTVTYVKGNGVYGRLYLEAVDSDYLMTLNIKGTGDAFKSGALEKQIKGMELAAFTENGTHNYQLYPVSMDYPNSTNNNLQIHKGYNYTGYIQYGIELVTM